MCVFVIFIHRRHTSLLVREFLDGDHFADPFYSDCVFFHTLMFVGRILKTGYFKNRS